MKIGIIGFVYLVFLKFGFSQEVYTDFEEAKNIAATQDKMILMVFSGSDWCKPCIQLKTDILKTESFRSFKKEHLLHLEVDFPYHKSNRLTDEQMAHNESLAERYNKGGAFPKILLLDSTGKVLGNILYKKGMKTTAFIAQIENRIQL